uniref:Uncharacterized protein n=1 Tax=Setaria italica TaxID=4555 RepID=K3ZBV2_SETIT
MHLLSCLKSFNIRTSKEATSQTRQAR